jgi:hypothetical protein
VAQRPSWRKGMRRGKVVAWQMGQGICGIGLRVIS